MIDVTGTFTLRTTPLFSLIDSSFTHSYVLSELACELGISVGNIDKDIIVTNSFGESVLINNVYCRYPLMIQGHVFFSNWMELTFYGFDLILGMDWLIKHKANIDSELKRVTL